MNFGERLKFELHNLGWNQSKLAKELGIHPSTVSRWIKAEDPPQDVASTLLPLNDLINVDWVVNADIVRIKLPQGSKATVIIERI